MKIEIGDRFRYTPQVPHEPSEVRIFRVTKIYIHRTWGDTRYVVIDEDSGERRRDYLESNFKCRAIEKL